LKDLVIRTGTNKLVADLVDLDRVRSLLASISERRQFLAKRQKAREASEEHGTYISVKIFSIVSTCVARRPTQRRRSTPELPEIIVVEDIPSTPTTPPPLPPMSSRDITSARRHSSSTEPETPTQRDRFDLSDLAPIGGSGGGAGPARSPSPSPSNESVGGLRRDRRHSDISALSADLGLRYTYVSHLLIHPSHLTPPRPFY
jgi:voltage-dependent calcium channel